ncbi:TusE/DsrC/DsvC family sulfur relay protein [Spartinivicinus poritis]|uniref:Sulfurtransferase n=1 Tax=Spartinivicinus poritis TaxID=2994640 RepID=A0ABT5U5F6_9GAMM|nr:TusE/DsrC/DsvC family sulfur relay protein [Spartinivicinus sp. A2-2]MDE1461588.1 TusE/DsrC/DsvC family sulfur relay protein [Spartinivicinus sp. A2-2]
MQCLTVLDKTIPLDKEGYLKQLSDWDQTVAEALAEQEGLELSDRHWEIIHALRDFYQQFEQSPAMRPFVKHIANSLGKDKGNSIYLMQLFPGSPAKLAAKIAGLPRPTNCF